MSDESRPGRRVTPDRRLRAAERLVGGVGMSAKRAAERFIKTAPEFGIDLDLLFATGGTSADDPVGQVCLVVPGAGGTAMLFASPPGDPRVCGPLERQAAERVGVIRAALEELSGGRFALGQALPEPHEVWAIRAFGAAGMTRVGDLAYLRRPMAGIEHLPHLEAWPEGVEVRPVGDVDDPERHAELAAALERSYIETLDCPALCGLRKTSEVIESHRATGVYDPNRWWLVWVDGQPEGCCLLSACPEHASVELVYMGLGPRARGRGLGRAVLVHGMRALRGVDAIEVTCAVDRGNAPALRLYEGLGFEAFTSRVAFVAPMRAKRKAL